MSLEINAAWVLDSLGVDHEAYWQVEDPLTMIDPRTVIVLVVTEHVIADFPVLLETVDTDSDAKAMLGRMVGVAMLDKARDILDRSWFHALYVDLARLDGHLGIDLSSDDSLKLAVRKYWDGMRQLVAEFKGDLAADRYMFDNDPEFTEDARGQLAFF